MSISDTSTVGQRTSVPSSVVSATSSNETTPSSQEASSKSSPINTLVAAGLVSEDLSDILVTPPNDTAVAKTRTFRIAGARNLISHEYADRSTEGTERVEREHKKEREENMLKRRKEMEKKRNKMKAKGKGKCERCKRTLSTTPRACRRVCLDTSPGSSR